MSIAATSFQFASCDDPECDNLHILLFNKDGKEFASMSITSKQIDDAKNTLYNIIMMKKN